MKKERVLSSARLSSTYSDTLLDIFSERRGRRKGSIVAESTAPTTLTTSKAEGNRANCSSWHP